VPSTGTRVAIPIWRDPWMVVGSRTFTGDPGARLGLAHVFADTAHNPRGERHPHVDLAQLDRDDIDLVLHPGARARSRPAPLQG
jgi:hypothetical protein